VRSELGVAGGQVKRALARIAERVSALKLNGRLLRRSPLSPLVECEALTAAIGAKHRLWAALGQMAHAYDLAVPGEDFDDLAAPSRQQLVALDRFHVEYAASAVRRGTATRAG